MDSISIYENGRQAGTLRRLREGLYTVFEASLPPGPELTRLWVSGGGETCSLGVMETRPDGRALRRRYSRAALQGLPPVMDRAFALPLGRDPQPFSPHPDAQSPKPEARAPQRIPPDARLSGPGFVVTPDGQRYLALPCRLRRRRQGLRLITLDGQDYLLFRI